MIVESGADGARPRGQGGGPSAAEAAQRAVALFAVYGRALLELLVVEDPSTDRAEAERRRVRMVAWMEREGLLPFLDQSAIGLVTSAVGRAVVAEITGAMGALETSATIAFALGLLDLGPVDRYCDAAALADVLPVPGEPTRAFVEECRFRNEDAIAAERRRTDRWSRRAESALANRPLAAPGPLSGTGRDGASDVFEIGGVGIDDLPEDVVERIAVVVGTRALAFAWLAGEA